jgi:transcriptional regulator with XRE-family HTH domain
MSTWATLIRDLQSRGMTFAQIGAEIGLSIGAVSDIANRRTESPRGTAALKLHELHRSRCGSPDQAA